MFPPALPFAIFSHKLLLHKARISSWHCLQPVSIVEVLVFDWDLAKMSL